MTHKTGTRQEWLAARLKLLKAEKDHMPPKQKLADNVIADFEKWVATGAPLALTACCHSRPSDASRARTAELLCTALSAAVRNAILYRSLLESIDDLARARREATERKG